MTITALYASQPNNKPKFNEFQTPVWQVPVGDGPGQSNTGWMGAKVVHCYVDKPSIQTDDKTKQPIIDPKTGVAKADFKVTLMFPKAALDTLLIPMRTLAATTRDEAWGPACAQDNWFQLEPFLRDGDNPAHNTMKKDYLMGHVYLNMKATATPVFDANKQFTHYTGAPGLLDVYGADMPVTDLYAGCYVRASGILFGTEYTGRKFISNRLNNIQKVADGERIGGGGRPTAASQFDPLMTRPGGLAVGGGAGGFGNIVL